MYKAATELKRFFSGFGLRAYQEGSIPEKDEHGNPVKPPYITYSLGQPEWNQKASGYARIWDRTTSNTFIIQKADEIAAAIGERKRISFSGGYLVIWPETPLIQTQVDGDARYAYLNLSYNYYNLPGV